MGITISFISGLKQIAGSRPQPQKKSLIEFPISFEIDDSDEEDLTIVDHIYPSKPDIPAAAVIPSRSLSEWQNSCQVLISGISIPVGLEYIDANGDPSNRQVEVRKIFRSLDSLRYLQGFCFLRNACRSFREDRIKELIHLETGQVYEPASLFLDLYSLFETPQMEKLQITIHILSYLARVDRDFASSEKELLSDLIGMFCSGEKKQAVEEYAYSHLVKKADFLNEVSKIEYLDEATVELIAAKTQEMAVADGKLTPREKELLELL